MPYLGLITMILLIVGGLNWLLVGLFEFNLVVALFGSVPILVTIVYVLVGLAAIYQLVQLIKSRA
jgi:uncharacterized membrane protein YuzA (DUF378 family)